MESKIGLRGGRFTRVNHVLWGAVAVLLTVGFYVSLMRWPDSTIVEVFTHRGRVQHATMAFTFWVLLIILIKSMKVRTQNIALEFRDLVPADADFVLGPATVDYVLQRLRSECDDPGRFVLFNRIELALSNLKNMGQIGDVDHVLQSQAANDDDVMESSYSFVKGLIWAIPVLGFIGTVSGLSTAIGRFGGVIAGGGAHMDDIIAGLQEVLGGLSTAFDTTFVALVSALICQLLVTIVRKREEEMLDACREYCQRYIVGRLRMMAFDR
ncbi:MAG: MotA/TolQ/ExbB proton channel family protein [Phycisphaerae bacterium]|nr:MotA/TolQ/ExbB proton channel family protein [Phycisphaerae bacterium]